MFTDHSIKVGYAPTRRAGDVPDPKYSLDNERAIRKKTRELFEKFGKVELVGIEWLNDEGLLVDPMDAEKVAARFRAEGVDALFIPHANFGSEEAVARLARMLGLPTLLYGPKDNSFPERMTDTQCGMFATSMALARAGAAFTYIENCKLEEPPFEEGLDRFVRAACVVRAFRKMRVGQISVRPQSFLSVRVNENELCERFGIEVVAIDTVELRSTYDTCLNDFPQEVDARVEKIKKARDCSDMDADRLRRSAAVELTIEHLARAHGCTAMAGQCFDLFEPGYDLWPCAAFGNLTEDGLVCACETDIIGAVSSTLLQAAARGDGSTFLTDLTVRHPDNPNAELLWHCGVFPPSLAKPGCANMCGMCFGSFELRQGALTLVRLGGINGQYKLFADEVKTTTGPATDSTYIWVETDNWPKWERKFIYGPYIHHISGAYGSYARVLHEACRYLPGIEADYVDPIYNEEV